MATFSRKKMAFIQLASTKGDIYAPTSGKIGLVHNIILFNSNTSAETVVINLHDGTSEYQLFEFVMDSKDSITLDFKGEGLIVDVASKLTGNTTTSSKVTCLVTGSEETV